MPATAGSHDVVIGMAHRGRLNVLAHIVGISYEALLAEFEAGRGGTDALTPKGGLDDVKYHLGAHGDYDTPAGQRAARHRLAQPEPPGGGQPGGRGTRPRAADGSVPRRRAGRPGPHPAGPDPRRRGLRRPGRGGRDAEPGAPGGLHHRRDGPHHRQQPGRLHHRPARGAARPTTPRTWPRATTSRSSTSTPTTPRPAWRRRGWR